MGKFKYNSKEKYYGEIWFSDDTSIKKFCVLFFKDNHIVLVTSLSHRQRQYSELEIEGIFNGIGYVVFMGCRTIFSSQNYVTVNHYRPKYTFTDVCRTKNLREFKSVEFKIVNEGLTKWFSNISLYDQETSKIELNRSTTSYFIKKLKLSIDVEYFQEINSNTEYTNFKNLVQLRFKSEVELKPLEIIDYYEKFQIALRLVFHSSDQFTSFEMKCSDCENWMGLYYRDDKFIKKNYSYLSLEFRNIKNDFEKILIAIFTNRHSNEISNRLVANILSSDKIHSRKFTNSMGTIESIYKCYVTTKTTTLEKKIKFYKKNFNEIGEIDDSEWSQFPNKVVRSRDYYIHGNLSNKNIFSEFELLYLSFLFDYVSLYILFENIDISKGSLDKIIIQGRSTYIDGKRLNQSLGRNPLE